MNKTKGKKHWLRALFGGLAVCVFGIALFGYVRSYSPAAVDTISEKLEELQKKSEQLTNQIKDLDNQLNTDKKDIKNEERKIVQLTDQISNVGQQIALLNTKIDNVNEAITIKELEIEQKLAEASLNEDLFAQRLRAMHISNTATSAMAALLESKSFVDFLNRTEYLKRFSETNNQLITTLKAQKSELDGLKSELEGQKSDLTRSKEELAGKKDTLNRLMNDSLIFKSEKLQMEKKLREMIDKTAAEQKNYDQEINRLLAELEGNDS